MNQIVKSFDLLSPKQRKIAISRIVDFFATERQEKIGIIAAEDLLDMFLEETGPHLFNKGVSEAKKLIKTRLQEIDLDIELLQKDI